MAHEWRPWTSGWGQGSNISWMTFYVRSPGCSLESSSHLLEGCILTSWCFDAFRIRSAWSSEFPVDPGDDPFVGWEWWWCGRGYRGPKTIFWRGWKWKLLSRVWLCNPMDYSPWDSPGQNTGVGSLSFPRGSSQPRDWTQIFTSFTRWATREAFEEGTWILLETERPTWGALSYQKSGGAGGRNGRVSWTLGGVFHAIGSLLASNSSG